MIEFYDWQNNDSPKLTIDRITIDRKTQDLNSTLKNKTIIIPKPKVQLRKAVDKEKNVEVKGRSGSKNFMKINK